MEIKEKTAMTMIKKKTIINQDRQDDQQNKQNRQLLDYFDNQDKQNHDKAKERLPYKTADGEKLVKIFMKKTNYICFYDMV
jgi:hypothetical protein